MKTGPPDPPAEALVELRKSRICESRTPTRARWVLNHVPLLGLRADDPENPSHHVPDPSIPRRNPPAAELPPDLLLLQHPKRPHTVHEGTPLQLQSGEVLVPHTRVGRHHVILGRHLATVARLQVENWSWNLGRQRGRDATPAH